jgi:hypothetical protein
MQRTIWTRQSFIRQAYRPRVAIPQKYEKILLALYQYYLLTTDLLVLAVGSPGSGSRVKAYVRQLEEWAHIARFPLRTAAGRSPLVCVLAVDGMKYLRDEKHLPMRDYTFPEEWKRFASTRLLHPLELNKLIIAASKVGEYHPQIALVSFEHDFLLKRTPLRSTTPYGTMRGVIPDAILNFAIRKEADAPMKRRVVWVELERGTYHRAEFEQKFHDIYQVITQGVFEARYRVPLVKVCFVSTQGADHVQWMRMIARQLLLKLRGRVNEKSMSNRTFYFAAIPPLQGGVISTPEVFLKPYWQHPFDPVGQEQVRYPLLEL